MPRTRSDLNGYLLRTPRTATVYLVDQGKKRRIPDRETFNNLFRGWGTIVEDIDLAEIVTGPTISRGAVLARGDGDRTVYLVDGKSKRAIANPATMDWYHFRWPSKARGTIVPKIVLDGIPRGPMIRKR